MTLVSFAGVALRFGERTLLRDVSFTVTRGERWGVVGRNGAGKTSLFELVTSGLVPAEGTVARATNLRIAVLDQHRRFEPSATVWDAAAGGFHELRRLEAAIATLAAAIGDAGEAASESLLASYARDLEQFEHQGGYTLTARVDAILHGLGFDPGDARTRLVDTLSGGERGRVGLAAQLAGGADLVLLDEPTNHLDLDGTRWLEEYLVSSGATALVISHDRAFLDAVTDRILHLEAGTAQVYVGGYRAFVEQRALARLSEQRAFDKQAKSIAKEADYIRRNLAGQNSAQARGRQRRLERLPRLSPPPDDLATMAVRFEPDQRGGDQVLVTDRLGVDIGGRTLLGEWSGTIRRGEVVGLVGPNGAGKTTLLATLLDERPASRGSARLGESIRVAYYRQDLAGVPRDQTLFDIIHDRRPLWTRGKVQDHLGRFGFSGDSVRRRPDGLSGGELARVALALLVLDRANFLIFDEPTNHLDLETIEALEDAITGFDGTVLLVSHDRALLRALTTRTWGLDHGRIEDFGGSFGEWEEMIRRRAIKAERSAADRRAEERAKTREARAPRVQARRSTSPVAEARQLAEAQEALIAKHERRVAELSEMLGDPTLYETGEGGRRAGELARELESTKGELNRAMLAWERAMEQWEADRGT